jgi:hypothetical protein
MKNINNSLVNNNLYIEIHPLASFAIVIALFLLFSKDEPTKLKRGKRDWENKTL